MILYSPVAHAAEPAAVFFDQPVYVINSSQIYLEVCTNIELVNVMAAERGLGAREVDVMVVSRDGTAIGKTRACMLQFKNASMAPVDMPLAA